MNTEFVTITVDGRELQAPKGAMLIEVTDKANIKVPRFCYHEKLAVAANCRMCLVEVEKAPKPLPACATPVMDGMVVYTQSAKAKEAQKSVMEFLLINHPLDCPICDQGGECELQDVAMGYGQDVSEYVEGKRVVFDKNIGPLIATELTRCIHCTRCVRFGREIAGLRELGMTGRGENALISTFLERSVDSELSGNVIDLCPVGALTAKPSRYGARSWEMVQHASIAPHDCIGSNVYIHTLRGQVRRVVPRDNEAVNEVWISDRDRFSYEGLASDDRVTAPMIRKDGVWVDADWDEALRLAASQIRQSLITSSDDDASDVDASSALAALISPSSTLEEMYLLQKLIRSLGSGSIDHRLRQSDFSDQDNAPVMPWLGQDIANLENIDAALLIGSHTRKEQPIINHRLRKAAVNKQAQISFINPRSFDANFPVANNISVAQQHLVHELAAVAAAAYALSGNPAPAYLADVVAKARPQPAHQSLVKQLQQGENSTVLVGSQAAMHPAYAAIRALAEAIAAQTGSIFGYLSDGANSAGAWLAGAVPHRGPCNTTDAVKGQPIADLIENAPTAAVLVNVEPEYDVAHSQALLDSLRRASAVVAITAFKSPALEDVASVILPAAAFSETSGTFVNAEGVTQSFNGANTPPGEARPGWKILRVLGNLLQLDGFDYVSSEQVRDELRSACEQMELDNSINDAPLVNVSAANDALMRATDVPIYATDALARRATSLQQTHDAVDLAVTLNPADAERLGLDDEEVTSVAVKQGEASATLRLILDASVPAGSAWIPAAVKGSERLGDPFGEVLIEKA
ncbi:MAG: NADH-quinone oxidoreductase subunit G [Gammaproteobacteria bacterium]|nr:NADH-quinone oxidoreductase subunit G [Gammaproteobacteria bacterium]